MGRFKKASKRRRKLKLALIGPSGSGKTMTAIMFALRLRELDAAEAGVDVETLELPLVIDTEHGSAEDYADQFDFDHAPMKPPYDPDRLVRALDAAAEDGYPVVVLDSFTHFWAGEGGVREIVDASGSGKFSGWKVGTPKHNRAVNAVLAYPGHVIVCMRARTEFVVTPDGKPTKVGVGADQRPGVDYEFQIVLELDVPPRDSRDHLFTVAKSRMGDALPVGASFVNPTGTAVDPIYEWLTSGAADEPEPTPPPAPADTGKQPELPAAPATPPEPAPAPPKALIPPELAKRDDETVPQRNARIVWRVLRLNERPGAVAVDEKVSTDTVRKAVKAAEKAGGDGAPADVAAPAAPAAPPAPATPPPADPPQAAPGNGSGPENAPDPVAPVRAWSPETTEAFEKVMAELRPLSPQTAWPELLAARSQEWYGCPLDDTNDAQARDLVERLTTTKLALEQKRREEAAAAAGASS